MKKPRAYAYIRMSREIQLKGDSLRRQKEAAIEYARLNNLELDEADIFQDIGVSAYESQNLYSGAFKEFLDKVRDQKIEKGSYLLVESFDRISRDVPRKAVNTIFEINSNGINIVTLSNGKTYHAENTEIFDIFEALIELSRSHNESKTKSERISKAWRNKQQNAHLKKVTKRCPSWLEPSKDMKSFQVIREKANIVKRIFEESAQGIGNYSIVRRLNKENIKPFNSENGWQSSSVNKILGGRTVLGEYQPTQKINGIRIPIGEPIANYYPKIIDEKLYYKVQELRRERQVNGAGRKGESISNLFKNMTFCAYCNGPVRYINKGQKPKGGTYFVCDRGYRGLDCDNTLWSYNDFEAAILQYVRELDLNSIKESDNIKNKYVLLESDLKTITGQYNSENEKLENLLLLIEGGHSKDYPALLTRISQRENEVSRLKNEINALKAKISILKNDTDEFKNIDDNVLKNLIIEIQMKDNNKNLYAIRSNISERLKSLISKISLAPSGYYYKMNKRDIEELKRFDLDDEDRKQILERDPFNSRKSTTTRYFTINFKSGLTRQVCIGRQDPLLPEALVYEVYEDDQAVKHFAMYQNFNKLN